MPYGLFVCPMGRGCQAGPPIPFLRSVRQEPMDPWHVGEVAGRPLPPSPCSAGHPGRSREWLRPCLFRQLGRAIRPLSGVIFIEHWISARPAPPGALRANPRFRLGRWLLGRCLSEPVHLVPSCWGIAAAFARAGGPRGKLRETSGNRRPGLFRCRPPGALTPHRTAF
jgi:hypothetical protein